ncbi:hypothetical protein NQ152_09850 [Microbacterium sp. zg.B48]|uniref:hypothetical protein n=1 Tax=Microbacterium sp. zg.B48 TaxID=2969408 RepID=UPI00214ACE56|nr:hypothetical protein [Microbacterium sp. zg.B48]MCR2763809.1 hypothetical protein [Microbacterium sp. zg.B48]
MDRDEKARMRNYIGEHLDVSDARLSDYQAQRLVDFIDNYAQYRWRSFERNSTHRGSVPTASTRAATQSSTLSPT